MSDMTRDQVLELAYEDLPWWPASGKGAREFMGNRFRDTQWRFGVIGHADEAFLFHERLQSISLQDIVAHAKKDRPEEWNGEGLPPVGAVVECVTPDGRAPGTVLAHATVSLGCVVIEFMSGDVDLFESDDLRPIRSEREKAVEEAMKAIGAEDGDFASILATVERMVAAGYRKEKS